MQAIEDRDSGFDYDEDETVYDEDDAEYVCERCRGDGRDPWCDYLFPCPLCQGDEL